MCFHPYRKSFAVPIQKTPRAQMSLETKCNLQLVGFSVTRFPDVATLITVHPSNPPCSGNGPVNLNGLLKMYVVQGIFGFEISLQTESEQSPESEAKTHEGTRSRRHCLVSGVLHF